MREVLDRLREAETAIDAQLHEVYYMRHTADRMRALELLWDAKKSLWYAMMHTFNAHAGVRPSGLDK